MSSNFSRGGQAGPRAESVDSRVEFFFDDQVPGVHENWIAITIKVITLTILVIDKKCTWPLIVSSSITTPVHSDFVQEEFYNGDERNEYEVLEEWCEEECELDRRRSWLPPKGNLQPLDVENETEDEVAGRQGVKRNPAGPARERIHPDIGRASVEYETAGDQASQSFPQCPVVLTAIFKDIASLLAVGVSTEQSKQTSKEFSLTFEEEGFSLMPSKLDGWRSRRAKEKNVFKMAALQQWGRAFAHISKKRREAVIGSTDPIVDYLLKEDIGLTSNKEAREFLFTGEYLERMLKEVHQDEILAKRDQAAASSTRGKRNPFRSTRRSMDVNSAKTNPFTVSRRNVEGLGVGEVWAIPEVGESADMPTKEGTIFRLM
ncbi:hypothetical protein OUZ56_026652 [Daphnia magna]|uniref:Uncharacterized protein n=1 Tax=Daphnia magna TaxID=35525 RepID=A0ABQ9ZMT5_9CRUS|nr:hypothetical protein OUZ56_026652 [Daphnia magna]